MSIHKHFFTSLIFNLPLISLAFTLHEFQYIQILCLSFFPIWWVLVRLLKKPLARLQAARWFPLIGTLFLSCCLAIPLLNDAHMTGLFQEEFLISALLVTLIAFAGYCGVYFSFSRRENLWSRIGYSATGLILWWWISEAITFYFPPLSWVLLLFALVPLFWKLAPLFPLEEYKQILKSKSPLTASLLLNIISNKDLPKKLRLDALARIDDDKHLFNLYLNRRLEDELAKTALEKIENDSILLKVISDEDEDEEFRKIGIWKIQEEGSLITPLKATQNEKIRKLMVEKIEDQDLLVSILTDEHYDFQVRKYSAAKIKDQEILFNILKQKPRLPLAFRLELLPFVDKPSIRKRILLDNTQDDEIRLSFLASIQDYALFKQVLLDLQMQKSRLKAIDEVKAPKILDAILQDSEFDLELKETAANELLAEDADLLSVPYLQIQLTKLLPSSLEKTNLRQVEQILRNIIAYYGQHEDLAFLNQHFPAKKVADWYKVFLEEKPIIYESKYNEQEVYQTWSQANAVRIHWAIANCFSLTPHYFALPAIYDGLFMLRDIWRKFKSSHRPQSNELYLLEMALAALMKSTGQCAAQSESYQNFKNDEQVLDKIRLTQVSINENSQKLSGLYQNRAKIIDRLEKEEGLSQSSIGLHPELLDQQGPIKLLELKIAELAEKKNVLERDLSAAKVLMQIVTNSQDYNNYIRQYASAGLEALLGKSYLEKSAIEEIRKVLNSLTVKHEKTEDEVNPDKESETKPEAHNSGFEPTEIDPRFSLYELRLMPNSKKGEVNLIVHSALSQLTGKREKLPKLAVFFQLIKETSQYLPEALHFFEQYPLRIMPRPLRNQLGYYRSTGYRLLMWTKYRPPREVPGNVIYRFLEVEDYSQPNSMGLVSSLFFNPLLLIPVLYHEYQHYKGIRNEANVWLREQYFLRNMIAEYAPADDSRLLGYLNQIVGLLLRTKDMLTLCLLKTDFQQPEQLKVFNALILHFYGPQMKESEALEVAKKQIQRENNHISKLNAQLQWDPAKRFPELGIPETDWETKTILGIVQAQRMQRNTITLDEVGEILRDKEIREYHKKWEGFLHRFEHWQNLFGSFPDLLSLYKRLVSFPQKEDVLIFKS